MQCGKRAKIGASAWRSRYARHRQCWKDTAVWTHDQLFALLVLLIYELLHFQNTLGLIMMLCTYVESCLSETTSLALQVELQTTQMSSIDKFIFNRWTSHYCDHPNVLSPGVSLIDCGVLLTLSKNIIMNLVSSFGSWSGVQARIYAVSDTDQFERRCDGPRPCTSVYLG